MLPLHELSAYHDHRSSHKLAQERAYIEACIRFERMHRQARLRRLWAALTGVSSALRSLAEIGGLASSGARRLADVQAVPLARIVGSDNRARDFDRGFAPLHSHIRQRWLSVAAARSEGRVLPPVDLIRVGDSYYVVDGHHRISVAHAFGEEAIDAIVVVYAHADVAAVALPAPVLA